MKPQGSKVYVKSVDALRTISILAVVLIHTTTRVLEKSGYNLNSFGLTLFLNQMARFAVPLFFLISGFVLELNYDNELNYFGYLKKRLNRIFIPYVFWSAIYYLFIYNQNHDNIITVLLSGNASYQLYFIPALLIFYMAFPLLHKIYDSLLNAVHYLEGYCKYIAMPLVLIFLGIIQMFLMRQDYLIHQFTFADPIRISLLAYFVFILGMVAARNKDAILKIADKTKYLLLIAVPYLIFYVFNEGKNLYFKTYNIEAFYSQWRISVLIYTLFLAALLFYLFEQPKFQVKFLEKMSKLSFLVFFIHVIVLESVWNLFGKFIYTSPGFDILFFVAVSGVSFGIAYLIHKIPNLAKITG